ncbi:CRTAC1 family protein [Niastella caeni]|uniref:CRTAC1 family protein n=1 Tax=Niastella caeni TaxID=2569763 RepID=A0A4S8HVF0_9BACT|nr:FG-GAP-like repeat-containing protein [Niastella caeni]THU39648.1 CRTAC1 family protein [Niastella caeni]
MTIAFPQTRLAIFLWLALFSCTSQKSNNKEMISLLSTVAASENSVNNSFASETKYAFYDSLLKKAVIYPDSATAIYGMANTLLELGQEEKAIVLFEGLLKSLPPTMLTNQKLIMKNLAIAYLRLGERKNCIYNHTGESCIYPIANKGIHVNKQGAEKAIELYKALLKYDPYDMESKWLLNIAYMATGEYPHQVPAPFLLSLPGADSSVAIKPFTDLSARVGLNIKNQAGGSVVDDFNNDGYADLITSSWSLQEGMHYFINNGNGTFSDAAISSGLKDLTGGLNMVQTDYNNDGWKDIFVLRGAWKGKFGKEPNSLLKNNGDGTFTDVTKEAGLLSFHPTQTATWADFNNDGWLDVFIGNESYGYDDINPCELYINNTDGTFSEATVKAGCDVVAFVKGVTSGDYNNDGWTDIFISTLNGKKILLKNEGVVNGFNHFKDVSLKAGLANNNTGTFTTWFWDYDNDGWLDILVCGYEFTKSLAWYSAAQAENAPIGNSGKIFLFRNNQDGTFEDVSEKSGLHTIAFAMGGNFGDIDNDGYLDFYLGTGNPQYTSLVPNKMFKNIAGARFADITISARVGNLQKGHGVSFIDLDNDGDQDIYIDMGGAYAGDAYENALYVNPGQNNNHRILFTFQGNQCNRAAIGARIKITFTENGMQRTIYRDVNSGGSFGANPLMQHIGTGAATVVDEVVIQWPGTKTTQVFKQLPADVVYTIKEGNPTFTTTRLNKFNFNSVTPNIIDCFPAAKAAVAGK